MGVRVEFVSASSVSPWCSETTNAHWSLYEPNPAVGRTLQTTTYRLTTEGFCIAFYYINTVLSRWEALAREYEERREDAERRGRQLRRNRTTQPRDKQTSLSESRNESRTVCEQMTMEAKLHAHDALRDEIVSRMRDKSRRNTRGVAAMVLIIGYAINFDQPAVIALVPVVFAYLLISTVDSHSWTMNTARHIAEIERDVSPRGSSFRYELKRGGLAGRENKRKQRLLRVPSVLRTILALLAYLVQVVFISFEIWPRPVPPTVLSIELTQGVIIVIYALLTLVLAVAGASVYRLRSELRDEIEASITDK